MTVFSIITVTRNNLSGLTATADSLRRQDMRDFEWIVIDGDSSDGTKAILHALPARTLSEPDRGIYDAMNKGIDRAKGDYLLFLNAGDVLAGADTLHRLVQAAGKADFIYGDALEDERVKPARPPGKMLYGMFTSHQAMLYARRAIGALRYDTAYTIAADYAFTVAYLRHCNGVFYCPFPVCVFETGGVSQTRPATGRDEQFRIRKALGLCPPGLNHAIRALQTATWCLRRAVPGVYWRVRGQKR